MKRVCHYLINVAPGLPIATSLFFAATVFIASPAGADEVPPLDCRGDGQVCREPKTLLPARVLTRPYSFVYKEKQATSENVTRDDVAAFSPLYIFAREEMSFADPQNVEGWYQVGETISGEPLGWMQAKDVLEWRQALVLSFTHPGVGTDARRPVIFFDSRDALDSVTNLDDAEREAEAERLYAAVSGAGDVPETVVSVEPSAFLDIKEQFYMLPILQHEDLGARFIDEARHVQIAAVAATRAEAGDLALGPRAPGQSSAELQDVAASAAEPEEEQSVAESPAAETAQSEGATAPASASVQTGGLRDATPAEPEAAASGVEDSASSGGASGGVLGDVPSAGTAGADTQGAAIGDLDPLPAESQAVSLERLGVDIVFVVDMTTSMVPFVAHATQAIEDVAQTIDKDPELGKKVRFGFVGYRDDVEAMPHLEFTARNFTPDGTLDVDAFLRLMESVNREMAEFAAQHENQTIGSGDYAEEVYAGVQEALSTQWSEPALRFVVLVGDASAHAVDHEQNTTGLDAESMRQQLNANKVNLLALHLKEERAASDHASAQMQYATLATNVGTDEAGYFAIPADDMASYNAAVEKITAGFTRLVAQTQSGNFAAVAEAAAAEAGAEAGDDAHGEQQAPDEVETAVAKLGYAALLPYLGKAEKPPRDFLAWAFDRDLLDTGKPALDVRVLLTREQVNDLVITAKYVSQAVKTAEVTQMQFFEALQTVTLVGVKGQEIDYDKVNQLRGSGLTAAWLDSLPYRSTILNMNNDVYAAMSPDERAQIENGLDAKLELYQELLANADIWIKPTENSPNENSFYPLELTSLP